MSAMSNFCRACGPRLALVLLALAAGCAGRWHQQRAKVIDSKDSEAGLGWVALRDGDATLASQHFARALERNPRDAGARFGAASLAYERGDDETALAYSLALLESASRDHDALSMRLAPAILSRLPRLLSEIPDRGPAEARLLALASDRLPWRVRYALTLSLLDMARKRADAALLAKASANCARAMSFVGTGGRLPYLDLESPAFVPEKQPRALLAEGCQFQLNVESGLPGIKVLRSEVMLAAGRYDIVLDFGGPARLRVDGGSWHRHGGDENTWGARTSAQRIEVAAGAHTVEIRIGTYGPTAELSLLAISAAPESPRESDGASDGTMGEGNAVMMELAAALVASLTIDLDALPAHVARLSEHPRFAVALAAAGRLGQADPTRPADIMRDKARGLWQRAVGAEPSLARVWLDLSNLDMQSDKPREAIDDARRAVQANPDWWPAHLGLAAALRAQGLEQPADAELAKALALVESGRGGCQAIDRALQRAEDREEFAAANRLANLLGRCDAQNDGPRAWARRRGDLAEVENLLRRALPTTSDPLWLRSELADLRTAQGRADAARSELAELVVLAPRDTRLRVRLADAEVAVGHPDRARALLAETLRLFPGQKEVRQAARLVGLPLPLDEYRLDGGQVIRDFLAAKHSYQAPAVVVLDRAVERVFADGARAILTHSITQVLSKDAIETVGEVQVPQGTEVLALRTRKPDGTLREAEEIAGKSSVSAPNLTVGDFVELETIEVNEPREASAPGFIGERFFFQSSEAPLDRSEYILIAPAARALDVDRRADAPVAAETRGPDRTRVLTFVAHACPQVFAERSAVPAQEWIPSVRVSSGIDLQSWSRFISDRFVRVGRGSPEIRALASDIAKGVKGDRSRLPEAIVAWVRENIEPENNYVEPATSTLARARGNRAGLILALARSLSVPADFVLARSLLSAEASAPLLPAELDEFRELLLRFPGVDGDRYVDPQIRRAPFDYLYPGYDGAPGVVLGTTQVVKAASGVKNGRNVTLRARLEADGGARVAVTEELSGWPAVEWSELLERTGKDRTKLRQEFEQRWLGQHFPGAQLDALSVEPGEGNHGTRVSYTFKSARMAARQGSVLRLRPLFFQAMPGRRFGSEPQRKTALQLGYDIPLDVDAEIELPSGATVLELGRGGDIAVGRARFTEDRRVNAVGLESSSILLHRQSRLPIMRVLPSDYPDVAVKLRAVDPVEQGEIRIAVPGK
jgi:tetratricopeptide (TPR) repeat protein